MNKITQKNIFKKDCELIVDYLGRQLVGPWGGNEEQLYGKEAPHLRYSMGTLYPQDSTSDSNLSEDKEDKTSVDDTDSPLGVMFQDLPASMGFSFYMEESDQIKVEVWAGTYSKINKEAIKSNEALEADQQTLRQDGHDNWPAWIRNSLATEENPFSVTAIKSLSAQTIDIFDGKAKIHLMWRTREKGLLVTVTVINAKTHDKDSKVKSEDCLYQVGFRCAPIDGKIKAYPSVSRLSYDEEEDELALQYQAQATYAVGHSCAVTWPLRPDFVQSTSMPIATVKPATTSLNSDVDSTLLSLQYLGKAGNQSVIIVDQLREFIKGYSGWIEKINADKVDDKFVDAKQRIISRTQETLSRMNKGVELLQSDSVAWQAFILANQAMLRQMIHSQEEFSAVLNKNEKIYIQPDYHAKKYENFAWRPFQLAFILVVVESMVNKDSPDRDILDLIWFPTGGGKTEAYLALAAFELIYRRLKFGSAGAGTSVIKRYTLRLLTSQQFQRASTLISCLELMRKENTPLLGSETFSLGLWVGETSSPNFYSKEGEHNSGAYQVFQKVMTDNPTENPFPLQQCPLCGTRIVPSKQTEDPSDFGVHVTQSSFKFYCPTTSCHLHESIPITVVDEDIYKNPPSLLIGTIDKFARLAWDHQAHNLFGNKKQGHLPPSLVIQDELHLISGPLGSIAGIYEAALETLITSKGQKPKYIAATATIRRAKEQVQKIYGKDVRIFPPPGLSSDDSYFARTDDTAPGRIYLGVMPQGTSPVTSVVRTTAALSQSIVECPVSDIAKDSWWTQVIYNNSKRELGRVMNLARDDIPERISVIATDQSKSRKISSVQELSSHVPGVEIPGVLSRLEKFFKEDEAIDILPCTNMISVGVDVERLGLMLINGQPKTTAEYIQASSRVGRSSDRPSGIVVTLYNAFKPRDRSHFESFKAYHSMLYRAVEPTSVTPFAPPARSRAVHAALVIVMRHAGNIGENDEAGKFDPSNENIQKLLDSLTERMCRAEPEEAKNIRQQLKFLANEWYKKTKNDDSGGPLLYDNTKSGQQFSSLLCRFEKPNSDSWRTLNSMRNVDTEIILGISGNK